MSVKKPDPPISVNTIRNLSDKLYDKRKLGALEVEQTVKELNKQQEHDKIMEVVLYLHESFIKSTSVSSKKGGLIGLAATALGLGQVPSCFLSMHQIKLFFHGVVVVFILNEFASKRLLRHPSSAPAMRYSHNTVVPLGCIKVYKSIGATCYPMLYRPRQQSEILCLRKPVQHCQGCARPSVAVL
jgi:hypothetical protein